MPATPLSAAEFFALNLVGRDVCMKEPRVMSRGPIKAVRRPADLVLFDKIWTACSTDGGESWIEISSASTQNLTVPLAKMTASQNDDGTITIGGSQYGEITIFAAGDNLPKPAE
jgi:hypothetical protein